MLMTLLRYREMPPFGLDGIRKIMSNRSELKKMTAHDYEDLLQVDAVDRYYTLPDLAYVVCDTCF